jgi:hypothetical protein
MYKKDKSKKLQLQHLNDVYVVFENYAINQNISPVNKKDYINLLLKNYINSNGIISDEEIQEIKNIQIKDNDE